MADRQFLRIDDKWALANDAQQWVLQRFEGMRKSGPRDGQEKWEAVSFVTSTKSVLARCMREKGVPTEAAIAALATLPDTFPEFLRQRGMEGGHSAMEGSAGIWDPRSVHQADARLQAG